MISDAICGRVRPNLRLFKEFDRYLARADRRAAQGTSVEQLQSQVLARVRDGAMLLDRLRFFVGAITERVPVQFHSLTGKAAYVVSTLLNVGLVALAGGLALSLALRGYYSLTGRAFDYESIPHFVSAHPLPFNIMLAVLLLIAIRRIGFRLEDKEQD